MQEGEIASKYGINLEELKKEQIKIAKAIEIKDKLKLEDINLIGAFENILVKNQIVSAVIVCDKNFEVIEQQFYLGKLNFPYLFEFRSYRELPAVLEAFNKLQNKPDIVLVPGHGILHPRLGFASHFSLSTGVPCIGVADLLFEDCKIEGEDILRGNKLVGKVLHSKEKSNPIYISPGSGISVENAFKLCKSFIVAPHKNPEPIHIAHKYAREVKKELGI